MGLNAKVDPLVVDLISSVQANEGGVKEATLSALRGVLKHAGKSVSAGAFAKVIPPLRELLGSEEDEFRGLAARTLGALSDVRGHWESFPERQSVPWPHYCSFAPLERV